MKAAKWVYETNRSPNESLRFGLQQPAQKAAVDIQLSANSR